MYTYQHILFDLDETLYTPNSGLWNAISGRIYTYMLDILGIPEADIHPLREAYLNQYGTTLGGLMTHYPDVNPDDYLAYVHDVDLDRFIPPDPQLDCTLAALPQKKVVFTNASRLHAERVLSRLGIGAHFEAIIGVEALDFINKPHPDAYTRALELIGDPEPATCVMVEDRAVNLKTAADFNMLTILLDDGETYPWVDHVVGSIHHILELLLGQHDSA